MTASVFASMLGMFTALRTSPLQQHGADLLRDFDAHAFLRFRGGGAEMRREDEIGQPAQRRIGRQRLLLRKHRAPPRRPASIFSASTSAASSIRPPRAQLTMRTPFFAFARRSALSMYFVSAVSGMCIVMKSACGMISSSVLDQLDLQRPRAARPRDTDRKPARACRRRWRAARSPCRCGPCRGWRASCCKARRPRTSCGPTCPPSRWRPPAGCCAPSRP